MQDPRTGHGAVQGRLGQELQLPIHAAEEVVHGHRLRPAAGMAGGSVTHPCGLCTHVHVHACTHRGRQGGVRCLGCSPGPPGLQQRQQHLDPTHEDGWVALPLQHVAQELLNGLLPGAGVGASGRRAGDGSPPLPGRPRNPLLQGGQQLIRLWAVLHLDHLLPAQADDVAQGLGRVGMLLGRERELRTLAGPGIKKPHALERGTCPRGQRATQTPGNTWEGENTDTGKERQPREGNQRRLPGRRDPDTNPTHAITASGQGVQ